LFLMVEFSRSAAENENSNFVKAEQSFVVFECGWNLRVSIHLA